MRCSSGMAALPQGGVGVYLVCLTGDVNVYGALLGIIYHHAASLMLSVASTRRG